MIWNVGDRVVLLSTKYANQRGAVVECPAPRTKFYCVRLDSGHYVTRITWEDMAKEEGSPVGSPSKIRVEP
jgi:hypothetical protein